MNDLELVRAAIAARENSYSPYSNFAVGAALLVPMGPCTAGAISKMRPIRRAIAPSARRFSAPSSTGIPDFTAIAVVGGPAGEPISELCAPCGVCRQVMREFCDPATFRILMGTSPDAFVEATLEELLPYGFGPENLGR